MESAKYGYKENRDIFKGDMDLLNKFRDFCNTGEVKPIEVNLFLKKKIKMITNMFGMIRKKKIKMRTWKH